MFTILAIVSASYALLNWLFRRQLFTVFWRFTPQFLRTLYPADPAIEWFAIRSTRNPYQGWDTAAIYLLLLPLVLCLTVGPYVFLVLKLGGIYDIGTGWIIIWFIGILVLYLVSAVNQYGLEVIKVHPGASSQAIMENMLSDLGRLGRRTMIHFLLNWLTGPLITLVLLIMYLLFVVLNGPGWVIGWVFHGFDMGKNKTRELYYMGYAMVCGILGAILLFL